MHTPAGTARCPCHRTAPTICAHTVGPCDCSVTLSWSQPRGFVWLLVWKRNSTNFLLPACPEGSSSKDIPISSLHVRLDSHLSKRPSPIILPQVVNSLKPLITLRLLVSAALSSNHITVHTFTVIAVSLLPPLEGRHPEDRSFILIVLCCIHSPLACTRGSVPTWGTKQ